MYKLFDHKPKVKYQYQLGPIRIIIKATQDETFKKVFPYAIYSSIYDDTSNWSYHKMVQMIDHDMTIKLITAMSGEPADLIQELKNTNLVCVCNLARMLEQQNDQFTSFTAKHN